MKTIKELNQKYGKVYVYLANQKTGKEFIEQAEKEGYTFGDGVKPTKRDYANIMAVNPDNTINYVGTNGRIAFQCNAVENRIDFEKYKNDNPNYFYESK